MKFNIRLLLGLFLFGILGLSLFVSFPLSAPTRNAIRFEQQLSTVPDGSKIAVYLMAQYDEAVEIEPAFTALLWYMMQHRMKVVFVPFLPESQTVLQHSVASLRGALPDDFSLPSFSISPVVAQERRWVLCRYTPASLFSLQELSLSAGRCRSGVGENAPFDFLRAMVVVGSENFDGMPAPFLFVLFGRPTQTALPLFVISSLLKRPSLEPLEQSGQVTAMLSGYKDGLSFADLVDSPLVYRKRGTALSLVLAFVLTLFLVPIIRSFIFLLKRGKE